MIIEFDWLEQESVQNVLSFIYSLLDIIKFIIPIILIIVTTIDITKKIIDPNEKEGQQKIIRRAIAAVIIFFLPTIINMFFDMIGVEIPRGNINSSLTNKQSSKKDKKESNISSLIITNCPNSLSTYHNGDSITLNTNIPSSYSDNVIWSIQEGFKYVNGSSSNNSKSFNLKFTNISGNGKVVINASIEGKSNTCTINVDKEKLDSLSYTNCPSTKNYYYIGDTIDLYTDIKDSFNGDITWSTDDDSAALIRAVGDKKKAKVDILDQPKNGYVLIKTLAGGKNAVCLINIAAIEELKITNCPSKDNIYHVGDTIVLNSNIPLYYKREPIWQSATNQNVFIITPIDNGRSAEIKIIGVPSSNIGAIGLGADLKGASCTFKIK